MSLYIFKDLVLYFLFFLLDEREICSGMLPVNILDGSSLVLIINHVITTRIYIQTLSWLICTNLKFLVASCLCWTKTGSLISLPGFLNMWRGVYQSEITSYGLSLFESNTWTSTLSTMQLSHRSSFIPSSSWLSPSGFLYLFPSNMISSFFECLGNCSPTMGKYVEVSQGVLEVKWPQNQCLCNKRGFLSFGSKILCL